MTRAGFHILRDAGVVTLARHLPPRFDVVAEAQFPPLRRGRLAQQIRQDLWRALQGVRGFSPVVEVTETSTGLRVRAGGRLLARAPATLTAKVAALLADPAQRARWIRCAAADSATSARYDAGALRRTACVDYTS